MNDRQKAFAQNYASDPNATRAALAAGYSSKSAYSQGQRLLKKAEIANYIKRLQAELDSERIADVKEIRERLTTTLRDNAERTSNRLRAADVLLKSSGAYIAPEEEQADTEGTENGETERTMIFLPWSANDDSARVNAIQRDDGEIIRLFPEDDESDIFIYATIKDLRQFFKWKSEHWEEICNDDTMEDEIFEQ